MIGLIIGFSPLFILNLTISPLRLFLGEMGKELECRSLRIIREVQADLKLFKMFPLRKVCQFVLKIDVIPTIKQTYSSKIYTYFCQTFKRRFYSK